MEYKCKYKDIFKSSFIFLISYIFIIVVFSEVSFADDTIACSSMNYAIEHSINAVIYDTNQYGADGSGQPLDAQGITVENWGYNNSKFLQVNIMVAAKQDEVHVVEIKLHTPFYSVSDVTDVPTGFSRVKMKKNDNISINDGRGTYYVNEGSGTLRYYLEPNMTRATIRLELRYDERLWDKLGNSPLTPEGVSPITVSLGHEESSSNSLLGQYSAMVYVAKATSGERLMGNGYNVLKRKWYCDYWDAEPEYFGYMGEPVRMWMFSTEKNTSLINKYYKRSTVVVNVPYYEKDGVKYYLDYDKDKLMFEGTTNGKIQGVVSQATDSYISFYLDGYYAYDNYAMSVYFSWPKGLTTDEEQLDFTGGSVTYKVISNANTEVEVFTNWIGKITLATKKYEKIIITDPEPSVTIEDVPKNSITKLAGILLKNAGTGESTEKKIDIKFNKKHLVSFMRLPADPDTMDYEVQYTLKDDKGEEVTIDGKKSWTIKIPNAYYKPKVIENLYNDINRNMLPTKQRKYYFNTISYTLASIDNGISLYYDGDATYGMWSAGYIYGKLASTAEVGECLTGTVTLTSPSSSGIDTRVQNFKSYVVSEESACYWVRDADFTKDQIKAGEVVYTYGNLSVSDNFYNASSTWLHNIRFALLLPNGVSIEKSSIDVRTSARNEKVKVEKLTNKKVDDNNTLWIIDLDKDVYIGYMSEDLGELANGNRLFYSIKLVTDTYMEEGALHSDKIVYFAGRGQENAIKDCRISYRTIDTWDLNDNGKTDDYIGCVAVCDRKTCTISANPSALDIKDRISIEGQGTVEGNDAIISDVGDILKYDLSIASKNDGTASSFEYYVPIIKTTSTVDDFMITSSKDTLYNLQLLEEASITGDDIYTIEYTTRQGVTYNQARTMSDIDWYTAEEMNTQNINYNEVTLLRITVKSSGTIEKGMDTTISIRMMYQGDSISADKGKYNAWRGCGYYDYDDGFKFVSGHFPAEGVTALFDATEPPKNDIVISTGEQIATGIMFPLYNVDGYRESVVSEPVEFMIERNSDSDVVTFALSRANEKTDTGSYVNKDLIKILDENSNKVESTGNNVYMLQANKKYTMIISKDALPVDEKSREYLYLHSIFGPISAVEKMILVRVSAFVEE